MNLKYIKSPAIKRKGAVLIGERNLLICGIPFWLLGVIVITGVQLLLPLDSPTCSCVFPGGSGPWGGNKPHSRQLAGLPGMSRCPGTWQDSQDDSMPTKRPMILGKPPTPCYLLAGSTRQLAQGGFFRVKVTESQMTLNDYPGLLFVPTPVCREHCGIPSWHVMKALASAAARWPVSDDSWQPTALLALTDLLSPPWLETFT